MFDYFFSDITSAYHASHVGKMGLGDGGDGTAGWSDMLLQGMVAVILLPYLFLVQ